jgi:hypothetical protein
VANFYDITTWSTKEWFQTGGTRNKLIVVNPSNNSDYYFKCSLKREVIDYKYEFWSEIIASEVGHFLGFDILKYDIAYNGKEVGCISESMTKEGINKLSEGKQYLTAFRPTYNPELKSSKKEYNFQFIKNSLKFAGLNQFINNIIQTIIFDAIIGNSDRHQENWGIITKLSNSSTQTLIDKILFTRQTLIDKFLSTNYSNAAIYLLDDPISFARKLRLFLKRSIHLESLDSFSKIYDSGSSLGREIPDSNIILMLKNPYLIENYIKKGKSEIHWESNKCNHMELLAKVCVEHKREVKRVLKRVEKRYNKQNIEDIVNNIDLHLPKELIYYKLLDERKNLIIKLITLRVDLLLSFLYESN